MDVDKWDNGEDRDATTYSSSVFVVSRLRKFTKYEIVIQAVNQYGEGPLSRPSVGQTQEDGKFFWNILRCIFNQKRPFIQTLLCKQALYRFKASRRRRCISKSDGELKESGDLRPWGAVSEMQISCKC